MPILYIYSLGKCIHVRQYPALPHVWNIQLLASKSLKMLWMNFSTQLALKKQWNVKRKKTFVLFSTERSPHVCPSFYRCVCHSYWIPTSFSAKWQRNKIITHIHGRVSEVFKHAIMCVRDKEQHKGSPCCRTFHLQIHGPVPLDKGHLCTNTHTQHAHRIHGPSVTMKMEMELNLTQVLYPQFTSFSNYRVCIRLHTKTHFVTVVSSEYIFLLHTPCSLHYCFQQFNKKEWGLCLKREWKNY